MPSNMNQLSPGVGITEFDMTTSLPAVSTSGGGFVGNFAWGPVDERTTVTDSTDLESYFHKPNDANYVDWFSAYNFLAYTKNLELVRAIDEFARNSSDKTPLVIKNDDHFGLVTSVGTPDCSFAAKYPGVIGDSIMISIADASTFDNWEYNDLFDTAPGTSEYTAQLGGSNDELHVVVVDKLGKFTGVPGSVLEKYPYASKAMDAKDINGGPNYFLEQLNRYSRYVWQLKPITNNEFAEINKAGNGGSGVELIHVTDGGAGYAQDADVTIISANVGAGGFLGKANVKNGVIVNVVVKNGGSGYTAPPFIVASGPGSGFNAIATVAGGAVTGITVIDGGTGYTTGTTFTFSGPGTGADATPIIKDGVITSVNIVKPGLGYTSGTLSAVGGSGFVANAIFAPALTVSDWGKKIIVNGVPTHYVPLNSVLTVSLNGGVDSKSVTSAERVEAFNLFSNAEVSDVSLIFVGAGGGHQHNKLVYQHVIDQVAEARKDCLAFCSPNLEDIRGKTMSVAADNVVKFRKGLNRSTSYGVMDSGWKTQFDVYNNKTRMVPLNPDVAGLCAQVDQTNDPWWSPGGYNRGRIKNIISLVFSPDKAARDKLFKNDINPVATFGNDGTILFGDKTLQGKSSAFSYIGVRRLFIVLKKMIGAAAKYTLFDFNTPYTRASFVNMVEPRLRDVKGRNGVHDYYVQCDERNNTDEVIQRGEFIATIFIKPMYSIRWISLNFVAIRREVRFEEVVNLTF